jgi:hypothetical protein
MQGTQLMSIYSEFVFDDILISPINGYTCKRITKQNIKCFGFDSVETLQEEYPDFPLLCSESSNKMALGKGSHKRLEYVKNIRKSHQEEKSNKDADYLANPKLCKRCHIPIPLEKRNWNFCSRQCSNSRQWSEEDKRIKSEAAKICGGIKVKRENYLKKLITKQCYNCSKEVKVSPKFLRCDEIYKCDSHICVEKIYKIYRSNAGLKGGKISASRQVRRSKQEIILYNLLSKHFANISHNEPIANGWDADILLHEYKTAILWNGPWHYREMGFKNHSLSQVVNRDIIKMSEFEKMDWEVLVYQDNQWSPEEAFIDVLIRIGTPGPTRTGNFSIMSQNF